jgi:hypothetical protein
MRNYSAKGYVFRGQGQFVLKLLITKEQLFTRRENKVLTTVDTLEHFIAEFHLGR